MCIYLLLMSCGFHFFFLKIIYNTLAIVAHVYSYISTSTNQHLKMLCILIFFSGYFYSLFLSFHKFISQEQQCCCCWISFVRLLQFMITFIIASVSVVLEIYSHLVVFIIACFIFGIFSIAISWLW